MVLYTIIPPEEIFSDDAEPAQIEASMGGIRVLVTPLGDGTARLERLLSTDPDHFLVPELQPGTIVTLVSTPSSGQLPHTRPF